MHNLIKLGVAVMTLAVLGAVVLIYQVNTAFNHGLYVTSPQQLEVSRGQYAHGVINRLAEQGIIKDPLLIKIALKIEPELAQIKSGTYQLQFGMTVRQLFDNLSNGKEKSFFITLVEGLRWRDWLGQMNQHPNLVAADLTSQDWVALLNSDLPGSAMEGWLLPDTYQFTNKTEVTAIVLRAHQAMKRYLNEQWQTRAVDLPYESPYEALIMASIIEKETGAAHERPRISGVFVNRLRDNMRLQTDPTVIYGLGDAFDGNIRRRDLRQKTAYNTYVIKGLPPTPIAMPGKLSIQATMQPLETDELYFVSRGDGTHQFSTTLKQHNQAVREYQLNQSSK